MQLGEKPFLGVGISSLGGKKWHFHPPCSTGLAEAAEPRLKWRSPARLDAILKFGTGSGADYPSLS